MEMFPALRRSATLTKKRRVKETSPLGRGEVRDICGIGNRGGLPGSEQNDERSSSTSSG